MTYTPLSPQEWIEMYGIEHFIQELAVIVPCSPELGCTDTICHGWRVASSADREKLENHIVTAATLCAGCGIIIGTPEKPMHVTYYAGAPNRRALTINRVFTCPRCCESCGPVLRGMAEALSA